MKNVLAFSDTLSADRFLRSLNISDGTCLSLILNIDGSLSDHKRQNPREYLSRWLVSKRIFISPIVDESALKSPPSKRQLKDGLGKTFIFVSGSNHNNNSLTQKKSFQDVKEAEAFLRSLNPTSDNINAIVELVDLENDPSRLTPPPPSSTQPTEQLIKKVSKSIANKDVAVVQAKINPPASSATSSDKDIEEGASSAPGNRPAELAPESDPKASINIALKEWNPKSKSDSAMAISQWKMTSPSSKSGTSAKISVVVPVGSTAAAVTVTPNAFTGDLVAAPVSDTPQATDYPIKIQHADWKDTTSKAAKPANEKIDWKFTVAELASLDNDDGLKARLRNLGFATDDENLTKKSVKAYQYMYLNEAAGSGKLADIKNDLMRHHDSA